MKFMKLGSKPDSFQNDGDNIRYEINLISLLRTSLHMWCVCKLLYLLFSPLCLSLAWGYVFWASCARFFL